MKLILSKLRIDTWTDADADKGVVFRKVIMIYNFNGYLFGYEWNNIITLLEKHEKKCLGRN